MGYSVQKNKDELGTFRTGAFVSLSPLVLHSSVACGKCVLNSLTIVWNWGFNKFSPKPLKDILPV